MKIVIIEDEELTASDLASTLRALSPEYHIARILYSVSESIDYFRSNYDYDLIFSDIELGDGQSFEIFKEVDIHKPVIFCTAFNEFALQAFESNGIDYILKPFDADTVEKSLTKLKNLSRVMKYNHQQLADAMTSPEKDTWKSLLIYYGDKIVPVRIEEIAMAYRENHVTYILHRDKAMIVNYSLDELEIHFGTTFFRANRQIIINRNCIREVSHYFFRKLLITPSVNFNGKIVVSKAKAGSFLEWLKK